jgi:hypothetical protein
VFTVAVTSLPIWNLALIKSGSLAKVSPTCGIGWGESSA